jgi:hypothetical protein
VNEEILSLYKSNIEFNIDLPFYFQANFSNRPVTAICLQFSIHKADIKPDPNALHDMPHVGSLQNAPDMKNKLFYGKMC